MGKILCGRCLCDKDTRDEPCEMCGSVPSSADVCKGRYTADELLSLGLSQNLVNFVMKEPRKGIFEYDCEEKLGGWICGLPDNVTLVYPLWSTNGDLTVVWMRAGQREFIQTYHDDPDFTFLGRTEQRFLGHLFQTLMESQDWDDAKETATSEKKLRTAATKLGFQHIDRFLAINATFNATSGTDAEEYDAGIERLIAELDHSTDA